MRYAIFLVLSLAFTAAYLANSMAMSDLANDYDNLRRLAKEAIAAGEERAHLETFPESHQATYRRMSLTRDAIIILGLACLLLVWRTTKRQGPRENVARGQ